MMEEIGIGPVKPALPEQPLGGGQYQHQQQQQHQHHQYHQDRDQGGPRQEFPVPRLLYEPVRDTKADILASMPARPVVDRMDSKFAACL